MSESPTGLERRMVHRLLVHWREAQSADVDFPSLADVMGRDLGDIKPLIYVLKVGSSEPEFLRVGPAFSDEVPDDLVGKPISVMSDKTLLGNALSYYRKIIEKKVPITMGGEFTNTRGEVILYRSIMVPLSNSAGKKICHLLGAANCKVKEV